jgi:hypothetical protein
MGRARRRHHRTTGLVGRGVRVASTEFTDEVLAGALLTHQGKLVHEATVKAFGVQAVKA